VRSGYCPGGPLLWATGTITGAGETNRDGLTVQITVSWRFHQAVFNGPTLLCVAVVGNPVAPALMGRRILEVNRLCARRDTPAALRWNAYSMLYGWCAREAERRGWHKIITYTCSDEPGTSLQDAGWERETVVRGRGWHSARRRRSNRNSWIDKARWSRTFVNKLPVAEPERRVPVMRCIYVDGTDDGKVSVRVGVAAWTENTGTVAGESLPSNGSFAVADPRPNLHREKGNAYVNGGHFGVIGWSGTANTVSGSGQHDNGAWSVADPRDQAPHDTAASSRLPEAQDRLVAVIRSLDGTWHRPFTILELAALQSLVDPEEQLELDGLSDADWRERIGNAVPPEAAKAIADTMGTTLLLAWTGESFMLSAMPIWVRGIAVGLSVSQEAMP
jgi:hypothetical protein